MSIEKQSYPTGITPAEVGAVCTDQDETEFVLSTLLFVDDLSFLSRIQLSKAAAILEKASAAKAAENEV